MFASHRCQLSRLAFVVGGLLLAGPAGAAITVTGGSTSPAIPPAGTGQSFSTNGELSIGLDSTPAIVTVDRTSELSGGSVTVGSAAGSIGQVSVFDRGAKLVGTSGGLTIGDEGDGWVTATDGAVLDFNQTGGSVTIGGQSGGVGRLTVSDLGSSLLAGSDLGVGLGGLGEIELSLGALGTVGGSVTLGQQSTAVGTATVHGPGSRMILGSGLTVGVEGAGGFHVLEGAVSTVPSAVVIGSASSGTGVVTVQGSGSRFTAGSTLQSGVQGNGQFVVADGAVATVAGGLRLGENTTGTGLATVVGSNSRLIVGADLQVGIQGYGEFEVTGGALATIASDLTVATSGRGGTGVVAIDGVGSQVTSAGTVRVGFAGRGEMYVSDGGSLSSDGSFFVGGFGSPGMVSVTGQRSRLSVGQSLTVGSSRGFPSDGGSTLSISDGAVVDADQGASVGVFQDGRLEMSGGSLLTNSLDVQGVLEGGGQLFGEVTVVAGGRVEVPANDHLRLMTTTLTTSSGDFLLAGGQLTLAGRLTHDTGDITLRDGAVLDTVATVSTGVLAATSGVSDIYGATTVEDLVIARDTTLVFHDGFTATNTSLQTDGSIVSLSPVSLSPAAATSMAISDTDDNAAISVVGSMDLAGGLVVSASSDVEDQALIGDVYSLIDANSLNGSFDSFVLPSLTGGRYLRPEQTATGFQLVVEGSIPGDFNFDNVVDAADYSLIRDGLGTTYTDVDLAVWAAYYGTVLSGPATAVPEPTAVVVSLLGLLAGCGFRRTA